MNYKKSPYLCRSWGIPEPTEDELKTKYPSKKLQNNKDYKMMNDVELVLRFFAYRQRLSHQKGGLNVYLDSFLKYGNSWDKDVRDHLEDLFVKTIQLVFELFGEKAFWLWRPLNKKWLWLQRPTTVVYDPIMYAFSRHIEDREEIAAAKGIFQSEIIKFYETNYSNFEGRYTNLSDINKRNDLFDKFIIKNLRKL